MKIRNDFVTNSSSSSFICLKLQGNLENKILESNGFPKEDSQELHDKWEENGYDDFELKGDLILVVGEGAYVSYIGYDLSEGELDTKTLMQIKQEMVDKFNKSYDFKITTNDIIFDYGEIVR